MSPGETIELASIVIAQEDVNKMKSIPETALGVKIVYRSAYGTEKIWCNDERIENL
jgi:hypothetical protein